MPRQAYYIASQASHVWPVMDTGPACKLFQRKLYSWLSSRRGLPLCIIGLLFLAISAFQFGEIALEWSKERYAAQFSIHHDNIAGKSFEKFMTPELPIDMVYTWVNGSDPVLLSELKKLKQDLAKKENVKKSKEKHKNKTESSPPVNKCPFTNCHPWKSLIVDAVNLSSSLSLSSFKHLFPTLMDDPIELIYLNTSSSHISPAYAVKMDFESKVSAHLKHPVLTSRDGLNISVTRGFLTTNSKLIGSIPLPRYIMITSSSLLPGNDTILQLLKQTLTNSITGRGTIIEVDIVSRGVAIASIDKENKWDETLLSTNVTFLHDVLKFQSVYAIWMPVDSQTEAHHKDNDIISQNRFQDNEELRYSLRSVEKYAPWIRHIYIVTNGQIPYWLNLDNPRISVVTHQDIYLNKSHLPTYSSPSIESHLHRIPGLSKWFLYLNDDVMFGQEVWPHDFFTPDGGQKVYLSWAVPNCADGCPPNWINDKYCDAACNVSLCDWDGGDCINATKPGPVGGARPGPQSWSTNKHPNDYCNTGCLNTWVGDRYCDNACNTATCGFDAGDCGTEHLTRVYHFDITPSTSHNSTFTIPLDTPAVYFNFSTVVNNDTITSAVRSPSHIVRTSILSKPYKILSLTFARNISKSSTHFTIKTQSTTISFTVIADTFKTNHTSSAADSNNKWSFVEYNDTTEQKFIDSLAIKVHDVDNSINAWVTERPTDRMALSPESSHHYYPNYTVANMSALPSNIAKELVRLQQELKDGDLTMKGFIKKQAVLLQPYSFLSEIQIIPTDVPNSNHRDSVSPPVNTNGHPSHARSELWHQEQKGTRHLMGVADFPSSWLPWERYNVFPSEVEEQEGDYRVPHYNSRKLLDTFADSLRYVNVLYTKEYGHRSRKVPAHMPHMINKYIMGELQRKYATQYDLTSSHKLRNVKDMQFAFSYFYYIMSEEVKVPINEVFDKLDTDRSGILSVRELRTLLVKVMEIPLTSKKIHEFESMLRFCAHNFNGTSPSVDPMDFESHYDPDLPLITLDFLTNCSALMSKIIKIYSSKPKYSCIQTDEEQVQFKMLTHNSTKVLAKLDEVRNDQRKFICLNDNLDHSTEDSKIARLLLQDFYESLFPLQSQFELPQNYRNRFLFMEELQKWLYMRWKVKITLQILCVILVGFCITSLFYGKIVQWKRKLFRICSNIFRSKRTTGKASTV